MGIVLAGLGCCVLGACAGAVGMPVVLNQDDTNFQYSFPAEKMTEAGAIEYFDLVNRGGNTHFFICANGHNAIFDSRTWDVVWRTSEGRADSSDDRSVANSKLLHDRGVDHVRVWIECCRRKGISPWITFRVNDVHSIERPRAVSRSRLWIDHPEYRRIPGEDGSRGWSRAAYDFTHREVRERKIAFAREMMERWDADGFECDFLRFPHLVNPEAERTRTGCAAMTEFMRGIRAAADDVGRVRGRRLLVGVRVAAMPEAAIGLGTDAIAWARDGLVDWVVAGNFFDCIDFSLPCAEWKVRLRAANPRVKFLAAMDCHGVHRAKVGGGLTRAECCAFFERMYAEGVDGFYFFNQFQCDPGNPVHSIIQIEGIGGEERVRSEARTYPVTFHDAVPEGMDSGEVFPASINERRTFVVPVGRVGNPEWAAVRVSLDGKLDEASARTLTVNGQNARACREIGLRPWIRERSPARNLYEFRIPKALLRDGVNEIAIGPAECGAKVWSVDLVMGAEAGKEGGK